MTFRCNEKRTHICIQRLKKITKHFCVFEWLRESWNTLKSYAIDVSAYDLHIFELCSYIVYARNAHMFNTLNVSATMSRISNERSYFENSIHYIKY